MNSEPFFMIIQSRTISILKVLKHKFKKEIVEHFSRNKKREIFFPKTQFNMGKHGLSYV